MEQLICFAGLLFARPAPGACEHPNRIANYDDISCETCGHVLTDEQTRVIEFVCGQYEHRELTGGPNALRPLLADHSRDVTKMAADPIGNATEKAAGQPSDDKRYAKLIGGCVELETPRL